MSDFPSAIYTPRALENRPGVVYDEANTKTLYAEDIENSNNEIIAIETELGANPKGAAANVAARIAALEAAIAGINPQAFKVGSIYMSVTGVNPVTELGYGTWTAWGSGRVPVGFDTGQTEFNTVEKIGGEKSHTLTSGEIPAHTHGWRSLVGDIVMHNAATATTLAQLSGILSATYSASKYFVQGSGTSGASSVGNGHLDASHEHDSFGGSGAHNNLQPYITCYMWKRTA